jgi:hypothetical protein
MGSYKTEGIEGGLLIEMVADGAPTHAGAAVANAKQNFTLIDPFFKGVFGMVTVEAEAQWYTGDYLEYDAGAGTDVDYDAMRFILDVGFDFGMMTAGLGFAHSDGRGANENDYTAGQFGGNDWEPFLIMTGFFDHSGAALLGGIGNFNQKNAQNTAGVPTNPSAVGPATTWADAGYDIFYLYGSWPVMENLTLNAIFGSATADETDRFQAAGAGSVDDAIGWEFDIGAKWQVMDNMTYDVKLGYFSPDDFWKAGVAGARDPDETYSIMHSVVVTF